MLLSIASSTIVGSAHVNLNFAKGCRWIGKKVNCEFDGGAVDLADVGC
jgi:hypothetical protein